MPVYSLLPTPLELSRRKELSTKLELYQGTRSARRKIEAELEELGKRKNLPLPHELMGIIFDFYVNLYGQLPERLLLVCRAWHVLALSWPTLWSNLDPLGSFGLCTIRPWVGIFLQARIARSDPVPLEVDFTSWSRSILFKDAEKIASIHTFRSRIQDLVVTYSQDLFYLVGDQPLLKHLTFGRLQALDDISKYPAKYKLSEKVLTTLRFKCRPETRIWPESFWPQLQSLEVTVEGRLQACPNCSAAIQKSIALLTLHITLRYSSVLLLSHASCRNLTILFCDGLCSLEEVRMPRLQELTIVTYNSDALMRLTLMATPISFLRLTCELYGDTDQAVRVSWVGSTIRLLRSTLRLQRFEISAPSDLIAGLLEAFAEDSNLCTELNAFIIHGPTGIESEANGYAQKKVEARFEQLRNNVSAFMDQRRFHWSKK